VGQGPTISFQLPHGEAVEVYMVKLPDGRIVARTREELEELPPEIRATAKPATPATPGGR